MYVYNVILHWGCFIKLVAYESPYVNFQEAFIFLCLSCYVFYMWETSDIFLGTLDYCLLYQFIRWWFDCSSWLDLSRLVLIHFPLIYSFFSWYLIRLAYIDLRSYRFTSCIRYFPDIILIHSIDSSIFFLFSFSLLIFSSWTLFFPHQYIHIGCP